ncbi:MAG: galactose mutarotase [Prevotellaceae bacterium]|jgi:aldose 1-epimerase|nr:galactose mutarotase [Prevotellaceae bacterium]
MMEKLPLLIAIAFQTLVGEKEVSLYTLHNGDITMQVTNFGARVVSLFTPDRTGRYEDIVLGYPDIESYLHNKGERFLGCVVGRYANRIAGGKFTLEGQEYTLPCNSGGQTLHGGIRGFDNVVWNVDSVSENQIVFSYTSVDGEEGFPGNLHVVMTYSLTRDNEFKITYTATTDKTTVVNLSHHSFFNLRGEAAGSVGNHILTLNAGHITEVNMALIPTGNLMPVENTPFDFRTPHPIGERIDESHQQLFFGSGYDHNWALDCKSINEPAAIVYEPESGRELTVFTDQPGIQFYSGNHFYGTAKGKYGKLHNRRESFALEPQKFPDSPNHPDFPTTVLKVGETYQQTCIYKFNTREQ